MEAPRPGPTTLTCAAHPNVVTGLRCGKCDRPICPRCLVQTPVGARCRDCAQLRRLPVFEVSAMQYGKAAGAAVAVALVAGLVWGALPFGGFFSLLLAGGAGYVIGEVASLAANRRRSRGLQGIAVGAVVLALIASRAAYPLYAAAAAGIPMSVVLSAAGGLTIATLSNPMAWLAILIGGVVAASRIG